MKKTKWLVAMNRSKQRLCQLFVAVYVVKLAKECRFVMKKATLLSGFGLKLAYFKDQGLVTMNVSGGNLFINAAPASAFAAVKVILSGTEA